MKLALGKRTMPEIGIGNKDNPCKEGIVFHNSTITVIVDEGSLTVTVICNHDYRQCNIDVLACLGKFEIVTADH